MAHVLAKFARSFDDFIVWLEDPLVWLYDFREKKKKDK